MTTYYNQRNYEHEAKYDKFMNDYFPIVKVADLKSKIVQPACRNSVFTDVRLAKNMWTRLIINGYESDYPTFSSDVIWAFTYKNQRHLIKFSQCGNHGQIHSISVNEKVVEKITTDLDKGFGPANYKIYMGGNNKTYKFSCVINLSLNDKGHTVFKLIIDNIPFKIARSNWIVKYLLEKEINSSNWEGISERSTRFNLDSPNEEVQKIWKFSYKKHKHKIMFNHKLENNNWTIVLDGVESKAHNNKKQIIASKLDNKSSDPITTIAFHISGLPCLIFVSKKNFEYYYELEIDGVLSEVYNELVYSKFVNQ